MKLALSSSFPPIFNIVNMPASDNPFPISAADDVWHQNKAQITDLYQNQRKTLKEIKHLMEAKRFPVRPYVLALFLSSELSSFKSGADFSISWDGQTGAFWLHRCSPIVFITESNLIETDTRAGYQHGRPRPEICYSFERRPSRRIGL